MNGAETRALAVTDAEKRSLESEHLGRLVDLYKHHYELFVKGYLFYLGIVGALTTLLFRFVEPKDAPLLCWLGIGVSALSVAACWLAYCWSGEVDGQLSGLAEGLRLPPIPLTNARRFTIVLLVLSAAVLLSFVIKLPPG